MNLTPLVAIWAVMAVTVLVLAGIRMMSATHEDDSIHLREGDVSAVQKQSAYAAKIAAMDKWGKTLTVLTVLYGLLLAGMYLYNVWLESTRVIS